jgi:gliding motility-associated-like protein
LATATVTVILTGLPDAGVNGELFACDTTSALELFTGLDGTPDTAGTWQDLDGSGGLLGGTLNANGLTLGEYHFLYTVTVTGCGSDTAVVTVRVAGKVEVEGLTRVCDELGGSSIISFTITGGDPGTYTVAGVPGTLGSTEPFLFTSDALPDTGQYAIVVADQYGCEPVFLLVAPCVYEPQIFVPESFSPNGDGINEVFVIPGLEDFPGNELRIFNRWGTELFRAKDYHTSTGWDGGGAANAWVSGPLPTGTYYYVLDLGTSAKPLRGFIYLNR